MDREHVRLDSQRQAGGQRAGPVREERMDGFVQLLTADEILPVAIVTPSISHVRTEDSKINISKLKTKRTEKVEQLRIIQKAVARTQTLLTLTEKAEQRTVT